MKLNMSFLIKNGKLLERYNEIWKKVENSIKKELDREKYLKAKIKSYNGKTNTNFHNNEIPKEGFQSICLSAIVFAKTGKIYYPPVFLKECKYVVKEKGYLSILGII